MDSAIVKPTFIKIQEVSRRVSMGHSTIWRAVKNKKFPAPIQRSKKDSVWVESEIDAYIQEVISKTRGVQRSALD
jgi:prophage regulatory protein